MDSPAWNKLELSLKTSPSKRKDRIKRSDIKKNVALYKVRLEIINNGWEPSAEKWTAEDQFRVFLMERAIEIDPTLAGVLSADDAASVYLQIRKNPKRRLLIETGEKYSWTCFYCDASDTPCNDEISLERLKPGKRGGQYVAGNVKIACMHHNRERSTKSLEDSVCRMEDVA